MSPKETILEQALGLTIRERAELVEALTESLYSDDQEAIDAAQLAEAKDRWEAYQRGEMDAISWEELKSQESWL